MKYRELGRTGLSVSEIGLGGEWLERQDLPAVEAVVERCRRHNINFLDCWMSEPNVRSNLGIALRQDRSSWIIQGHLGSVWRNGQYVRSRDLTEVRTAFADLLTRLQTDYIDLGMIHFVDRPEEFRQIMDGPFFRYAQSLKEQGVIRHIGMSTHNPAVGKLAAESGCIEVLLFSVNPAFDMLPATEDLNTYFEGDYSAAGNHIAPERAELYETCVRQGVGITVMKGFAGGRLLSAGTSPFGVALTPLQCLHYALTRPAVASVLVGFSTPEHVDEAVAYETASESEKDYATVLAQAPRHPYSGKCTYCGHCAPCPAGIDVAMVNKLSDLAAMQPELPATLREHYADLRAHASDCIHCGGCESRCPFQVPVMRRMEETAKRFSY